MTVDQQRMDRESFTNLTDKSYYPPVILQRGRSWVQIFYGLNNVDDLANFISRELEFDHSSKWHKQEPPLQTHPKLILIISSIEMFRLIRLIKHWKWPSTTYFCNVLGNNSCSAEAILIESRPEGNLSSLRLLCERFSSSSRSCELRSAGRLSTPFKHLKAARGSSQHLWMS